jgi:glycosyltransferase involved in cell wall biosynthesis|tara:strand:+ start:2643 stop:3551 length:909 start_codon:yes stop_codon:yes gene_type:complete
MEEMKQPLVSIVMNCYNGEKYLRFAIESVFSQTFENWEIIFWDNQSTDTSAEIFKSYNDGRFKYYYAKKHSVLYEARNYAIKKCNGELIAFLDVDDAWLSNKLKIQVALLQDQNIGLSCTNYSFINERNLNKLKIYAAYTSLPFGSVLNDIFKEYFVHISTLLVRKKAIDQLEYVFDPRFNIIGDLDFVIRLCKDWDVATVQTPVAYYRFHNNNTGNKEGFEMSDEYDIWEKDLKNNIDFHKYENFHLLINKMRMYKVFKLLYDGKRLEAITISQELGIKFRLKTIVAAMLPRFVLRRYIYF